MGSPLYLSPEQARAEGVGPASDIYSLAVLLYEGVAGRCPFEGAPVRVLIQHHSEEPPPAIVLRRPHPPGPGRRDPQGPEQGSRRAPTEHGRLRGRSRGAGAAYGTGSTALPRPFRPEAPHPVLTTFRGGGSSFGRGGTGRAGPRRRGDPPHHAPVRAASLSSGAVSGAGSGASLSSGLASRVGAGRISTLRRRVSRRRWRFSLRGQGGEAGDGAHGPGPPARGTRPSACGAGGRACRPRPRPGTGGKGGARGERPLAFVCVASPGRETAGSSGERRRPEAPVLSSRRVFAARRPTSFAPTTKGRWPSSSMPRSWARGFDSRACISSRREGAVGREASTGAPCPAGWPRPWSISIIVRSASSSSLRSGSGLGAR